MMMVEGSAHLDVERDGWQWSAGNELGENSLLWLTDAMDNSLMGLSIQAPSAPVDGDDDTARLEQQSQAVAVVPPQPSRKQPNITFTVKPGSAAAQAAPAVASSSDLQSPYQPPLPHQQQLQPTPDQAAYNLSEQSPVNMYYEGDNNACIDTASETEGAFASASVATSVQQHEDAALDSFNHFGVHKAPSSSGLPQPAEKTTKTGKLSSETALKTPRRPSSSSSSSSSSSARQSSSTGTRKPKKIRPSPVMEPPVIAPAPAAGTGSAIKKSPSPRIDVRLIPHDPATAEVVKNAGYCPKLELKTPSNKCVGFFMNHLSKKWSLIATIDKLQLYLVPVGAVTASRSPTGKITITDPPLPSDTTLDCLSSHFDIQVSKERPILFLCYSLPTEERPRAAESSLSTTTTNNNWACEDLSNLLCSSAVSTDGHLPAKTVLQPHTYTLSAEDASLLRGMPDVSFSLPGADFNKDAGGHPPTTPAQTAASSSSTTFCWQSELGSLRASATSSATSTMLGGCDGGKADMGYMQSPTKKRPLYSGSNQGLDHHAQLPNADSSSFAPFSIHDHDEVLITTTSTSSSSSTSYNTSTQAKGKSAGGGSSEKKKRRITPALISSCVSLPGPPVAPPPPQDTSKENMTYIAI